MEGKTPVKIKLSLAVQPDDPTSIDSGDQANDVEIRSRVNRGDVWAWAHVNVEARIEHEGQTFVGGASLGGCSFENGHDFQKSTQWDGLKRDAIEAMWEQVRAASGRGLGAMSLLLRKQMERFEINEQLTEVRGPREGSDPEGPRRGHPVASLPEGGQATTHNVRFARNLRRIRKQKNISQERLAEKAGISGPYVNQLESGARAAPSYPTLLSLAKALGCEMKDLVS